MKELIKIGIVTLEKIRNIFQLRNIAKSKATLLFHKFEILDMHRGSSLWQQIKHL